MSPGWATLGKEWVTGNRSLATLPNVSMLKSSQLGKDPAFAGRREKLTRMLKGLVVQLEAELRL
jgi:hypothetical protein